METVDITRKEKSQIADNKQRPSHTLLDARGGLVCTSWDLSALSY
jgi:hypothetical protein